MTITATQTYATYMGNSASTNFPFSFIIPDSASCVVTLTTIATGATQVLSPTVYTLNGAGNAAGGSIDYPLIGSPITSATNITVQRIESETQTTDLTSQDGLYPDTIENALDKVTRLVQQVQTDVNNALAFPIGASALPASALITATLNAAANATAAAASAVAAAASAASVAGLVPVNAAGIQTAAVTEPKIADGNVTPRKLATSSVPYGAVMLNGTLVTSVTGNALTIALKTKAGTDPSATDPVYVFFRDATVGLGDFAVLTVIAATSLVISSGSTMGFTSAVSGRLWVVGFNDAGTFRLGAINTLTYSGGVANITPLGAWQIATSTAEGGAGAADSAGVFYTGTAVAAKAYVPLGFLTWETALGAAGAWAAVPTRMQLYNMATALPGTAVQKVYTPVTGVSTGTTTIPLDNTIPTITEGTQFLTRAITPASGANLLEIEAKLHVASTAITTVGMTLNDGTNTVAATLQEVTPVNTVFSATINYNVIPSAVISTTYNVRAGGSAASTITANGASAAGLYGGVLTSYIKITEWQV